MAQALPSSPPPLVLFRFRRPPRFSFLALSGLARSGQGMFVLVFAPSLFFCVPLLVSTAAAAAGGDGGGGDGGGGGGLACLLPAASSLLPAACCLPPAAFLLLQHPFAMKKRICRTGKHHGTEGRNYALQSQSNVFKSLIPWRAPPCVCRGRRIPL